MVKAVKPWVTLHGVAVYHIDVHCVISCSIAGNGLHYYPVDTACSVNNCGLVTNSRQRSPSFIHHVGVPVVLNTG